MAYKFIDIYFYEFEISCIKPLYLVLKLEYTDYEIIITFAN